MILLFLLLFLLIILFFNRWYLIPRDFLLQRARW